MTEEPFCTVRKAIKISVSNVHTLQISNFLQTDGMFAFVSILNDIENCMILWVIPNTKLQKISGNFKFKFQSVETMHVINLILKFEL